MVAVSRPPETIVVQPGWYPDREDRGLERYWNGEGWANDWRPRQPLPATDRRTILQQTVSSWVSQTGAKVEYQDDQRAVLGLYDKPNHVLHGILSVITLGLWLIVWLLVVEAPRGRRVLSSGVSGGAPACVQDLTR